MDTTHGDLNDLAHLRPFAGNDQPGKQLPRQGKRRVVETCEAYIDGVTVNVHIGNIGVTDEVPGLEAEPDW
jgi:hypothetical protein